MNTYKLRAETVNDILRLVVQLDQLRTGDMFVTMDKDGLPDCELEIVTWYDLDRMRSYCREIPDGHVMLQTIRLKEKYTGIRDYEIQ